MRSAGLFADATCLHSHPAVSSWIWGTLLATNVFHLLDEAVNHESTIVESVYNMILSVFKFNAGTVFCINCARSKAAHNSKLGIMAFFTGTTLDLEQSSLVVTSPCWLTELKYKHAPQAISLESQNTCNWISVGCPFAKTNLSTANPFTWDRRNYMSIHWFNNSNGSCSSQSSLCSHNCCRKILYTTTWLIKPSGSNIVTTIEKIISLLTGEF